MMEDRDDGDGDVEAGGAEAREGDPAPDIIQPFDLPRPSADRRRSGCLRLRARVATSRRWCGSCVSTAPEDLDSFEAAHVVALAFPLLGSLPAVVICSAIYMSPDLAYDGVSTVSEFYSYTPKAVILEPFSTLTNLSFWAAGVGLYILPFLSYERLPPQAFGAGMLLVLLGGCSGAFHADGSREGTWRHATDRVMMYALAVYIAVISIGGLIQALRGQPADPRSTLSLVLNLLAPFSVVIVVLYQESIETSVLYISAYGPVTIICGVIAATLKPPELGVRLFAFARNLVVQFGVISVSFYINLYRGRYYLTQVLDHSVPGTEFKEDVGMGLVEPLPSIDVPKETFETAETLGDTDARMRELRRLHDIAHGSAHILNAIVVSAMVMTVVEGLSGRQRQRHSTLGMAAQLLTCVVAALLFVFALIENSRAWLILWVGIEAVALPLSLLLLARVVRKSARRSVPSGAESIETQTDALRSGSPAARSEADAEGGHGPDWSSWRLRSSRRGHVRARSDPSKLREMLAALPLPPWSGRSRDGPRRAAAAPDWCAPSGGSGHVSPEGGESDAELVPIFREEGDEGDDAPLGPLAA